MRSLILASHQKVGYDVVKLVGFDERSDSRGLLTATPIHRNAVSSTMMVRVQARNRCGQRLRSAQVGQF